MSELETKNAAPTLEALAAEINEEHRRCEAAFKTGLQHALRAGELLVEAKSLCEHGEWGRWIEENFEGSERTAQAYMKVFREALKELAAPPEPKKEAADNPEEMADLIRSLMETYGPTVRDAEHKAYESRLAAPGPKEENLLQDMGVSQLKLLAAQVAVDGFLLELTDEGEVQMTYRSADKTKVCAVWRPVDEKNYTERLQRGCEQYALDHFRMWRLLDNWLTEVIVSHPAKSSVVTERILRNADWRKAEPASEHIYHEVFGDEDERWFAKETGVDLGEFREIVGAVRVWLSIEALRLKKKS